MSDSPTSDDLAEGFAYLGATYDHAGALRRVGLSVGVGGVIGYLIRGPK